MNEYPAHIQFMQLSCYSWDGLSCFLIPKTETMWHDRAQQHHQYLFRIIENNFHRWTIYLPFCGQNRYWSIKKRKPFRLKSPSRILLYINMSNAPSTIICICKDRQNSTRWPIAFIAHQFLVENWISWKPTTELILRTTKMPCLRQTNILPTISAELYQRNRLSVTSIKPVFL